MAAGKIFKYSPKRRTRKSSGFKKAVTAIAKKAVMSTSETRTATIDPGNIQFGINGVLLRIWENIVKGDNQENRDGDEIRALGVRMRGLIYQNTTLLTGLRDQNIVRMVVASGKRPLTSGDFPTYKGTFDSEVMTVLHDSYVNFDTTKSLKTVNKYFKFNRKVLYQGAGVNKNELYFWFVPIGGNGITTTTGNVLDLSFQPYFKDL